MRLHFFGGVLFVPLLIGAGCHEKDYAQEYVQPFKGKPDDMPAFKLVGGRQAKDLLKYEPNGMRITLPLGYPGTRPGTGLELASKVKGDFEITVNFEVLDEPDQVPADGLATRVTLGVVLDMSELHEGSISRRIVGKGRYDFFTYLVTPKEGPGKNQPLMQTFPATAKSGSLRLERAGSKLSCYVSDGGNDNFTLLKEFPFNAADVKSLYITTATWGPQEALDVRLTDLHIRADSVENGHATPPEFALTGWLAAAGILVLVVILTLAVFFWLKKSGKAEKE